MIAVAQAVPQCELFIYVDGASDRTLERLEPFKDRINIVAAEVRRGKSHGMNVLVDRCTADVVVFTDANVELDGNTAEGAVPAVVAARHAEHHAVVAQVDLALAAEVALGHARRQPLLVLVRQTLEGARH